MNKIIETKASAYVVTQKVASWFHVKRDELAADVDAWQYEAGSKFWHSPMLQQQKGFYHHIYCYKTNKLNLAELMDWDKLQKTDMYQAFLLSKGMLPLNLQYSYLFALHLKGTVWLVKEAVGNYYGLGGIYVGSHTQGLSIEPIKNYLTYQYIYRE